VIFEGEVAKGRHQDVHQHCREIDVLENTLKTSTLWERPISLIHLPVCMALETLQEDLDFGWDGSRHRACRQRTDKPMVFQELWIE
jgi:hypothetical protein